MKLDPIVDRFFLILMLASQSLLACDILSGVANGDDISTSLPDGHASWGAPITISPNGNLVWAVNPDSGSITVIDTRNFEKTREIKVGEEPWSIAISDDGSKVYVLDRAAGTLVMIDALKYRIENILPIGPEPTAIALTPNGSMAYITMSTSAQVRVFDTSSLNIIANISVDPHPYAIAIKDNGDNTDEDERVYVTHFLAFTNPGLPEATDDGRYGQVTVLSTAKNEVLTKITLSPNENGFPNLLAGISLLGSRAWIPQVRDMPALPNSLTKTVFASVSILDLEQEFEDSQADLPLNDQIIFGSPVNNPVAAVPSSDGKFLYVVLAGSNLIEVIDIADAYEPKLLKFIPTGLNPRGMVLSRDNRHGYVMNYLSRSVTVLDLESRSVIAEVPTMTESLPANILRGKILFHTATDPRLSGGSWVSCASCHPDGGSDTVTWMFPDGPRQTPGLWNSGATAPYHWSAALDELQDAEVTIELVQHGIGLSPGRQFSLLETPIAGSSPDLDALASFVADGIRVPALPVQDEIDEGREIFQTFGCTQCHGGPTWTSSSLIALAGSTDRDGNGMVDEVLQQVNTVNSLDVRGATGFDPPSLLLVGLTAPYLHDGSMLTIEALLESGHPNPGQNQFSAEQIFALASFLNSIGPETIPIEVR